MKHRRREERLSGKTQHKGGKKTPMDATQIILVVVTLILWGLALAIFLNIVHVGKKKMPLAMIILIVLGCVPVTMLFGWVPTPDFETQTQSAGNQQPIQTNQQSSGTCYMQDDGANDFLVAVINGQAAAGGYIGVPLSVESIDGQKTYATGTSTTGSTLSYATIDVKEGTCKSATVYGLANASVTSFTKQYIFDTPTVSDVIDGALTSQVNAQFRDSGLTVANGNATYPNSDLVAGTTVYHNETLGSGGSANFYLDLQLASGETVFGNLNDPAGVIVSAYISDLTKNSINSISLSGTNVAATKITCPGDIATNRRASVCWSMRTLKAADGLVRLPGTMKCDLGDCADGDYIALYIDDVVWFRDTDGKIKKGSFNSAGTNEGEGGTTATIQFV